MLCNINTKEGFIMLKNSHLSAIWALALFFLIACQLARMVETFGWFCLLPDIFGKLVCYS